ncbi:MAG: hypothetical protein HY286_17090 [Planctomycetes bacterium]|nr:hypothetical protein [Planctomycetota bacterium]
MGGGAFGLGFLLHISIAGAGDIQVFDMYSDYAGAAAAAAPIPNNPTLAGRDYFIQSVWIETMPDCHPASAYGLLSAKGMKIKIAP